jgi:hypothetical protein
MAKRRFTPPWDIEDNGSCFIIRGNNGQALSYVYYEQEPGPAHRCRITHARRSAGHRHQYRQAAGGAE